MKSILEINATEARKNIYKLIEEVSGGNVSVVIHNTDTNKKVMLSAIKPVDDEKYVRKDVQLVAEMAGVIKTTGYKKDEFEQARKAFVNDYLIKNGT